MTDERELVDCDEWDAWWKEQGQYLGRDVGVFVKNMWHTIEKFERALERANNKLEEAERVKDELSYCDYDIEEVY